MATCSFFGHSENIAEGTENLLCSILIDLIETKHVNEFFVGNHGQFDIMVRGLLKKLNLIYPQIKYSVVLAYFPTKKSDEDFSDTCFPEALAAVPPRFAIDKRNRWLIEKSDIVVTYVCHSYGGAARYKALAEKKGKTVINIADIK